MILKVRALPISAYALLMAALVFAAFLAYALFTFSEFQRVKQDLESNHRQAARLELVAAVDLILTETQAAARDLAATDGVLQQLRQPGDSAGWRNARLFAAGVLPDYVRAAAIYTAGGQAPAGSGGARLPRQPGAPPPAPYVEFNDGEPSLLVFVAVHKGTAAGAYVGLQTAILERLRTVSPYRYLEPSSIMFSDVSGGRVAWPDLVDSVVFQLRDNPMSAAVEDMLTTAVRNLSIILGLFILLLFPAVVFLLVRPLRAISMHIDRLKQSRTSGGLVLDRLAGWLPIAETEKIKDSLNDYQGRLQDVHSSLEEKRNELWTLVHHDALTGAKNRRAFDEYLQQMPRSITRRGHGICFALFDVNRFKAINDTYGHRVGDALLKSIAASISSILRRGEDLFRIGADEFAVVLLDCDATKALRIAGRCEDAIAATDFKRLGIREPAKVSIGLAAAQPDDVRAIDTLRWKADVAMYYAKRPGHAGIALFREEMAQQSEGLFSSWVNNAVLEAVTQGTGLQMFYQPVVDIGRGGIAYFESLLRIRRDAEWILPGTLFPVVEARRLETELDRAVIACVYRDMTAGRIRAGTGVSINLSGPTVVNEHLAEWLSGFLPLLADYRIVLEVTETALITQIGIANDNLHHLREQGFEIALDDFGSGYSSIRYLANMPVDTVKFDISLTRALADAEHRRMVEHLVILISEAGHRLVAEGIESVESLGMVHQVGFAYGQGYYYARPSRNALLLDFEPGNVRPLPDAGAGMS